MTEDAERWSERDLDERFAVGPAHDEISRLAATLDGLLDRLAASVRRERRLTAEVSHELRTPLAQIQAEVDLALRRQRTPTSTSVRSRRSAQRQRIGATIETLLATARQDGHAPWHRRRGRGRHPGGRRGRTARRRAARRRARRSTIEARGRASSRR